MLPLSLLVIVGLSLALFVTARSRAITAAGGRLANLHSRPGYHGMFAMLCVLLAGVGTVMVVNIIGSYMVTGALHDALERIAPDLSDLAAESALNDARALVQGDVVSKTDAVREELAGVFADLNTTRVWVVSVAGVLAGLVAGIWALSKVSTSFRARNRSERILRTILWVAATVAVVTTVGIFLSLIGETLNFFDKIDWQVHKFLFGTTWSPLAGVHVGEMSPDKVGAVPLFLGTLMITVIAMLVALPIGLFSAIYLSEFASARVRSGVKPILEILAGIPTVVYGFFAATTVAPFMVGAGQAIGLTVEAESALTAGIVMGIMIIPFISSLSDDVINAVPQSLRDGSYGLGATQ
ncbi:MAG: phosphate ABC transporter permease family protein, partial [Pseudomonadota bacterium]